MEAKVKKDLRNKIKSSMESYSTNKVEEDGKKDGFGILSKEVELIQKIEAHDSKIANEKDKLKADINLGLEKLELEKERIQLEKNKLKFEKESYSKDKKSEKWGRILNISLSVAGIVLPLAVHCIYANRQLRLVYKDDGRIPSDMYNFLKNIPKTKL